MQQSFFQLKDISLKIVLNVIKSEKVYFTQVHKSYRFKFVTVLSMLQLSMEIKSNQLIELSSNMFASLMAACRTLIHYKMFNKCFRLIFPMQTNWCSI